MILRKIVGAIFPALFVAIGTFFLIKAGIPSIGKYFEHKTHVQVEAKLIEAQIDEKRGTSGEFEYFLTAKYQYTLGGKSYIIERDKNTINSPHLQRNKKIALEDTLDDWKEKGFESYRIDPKEPNNIQKGDLVTIGVLLFILILPSLFILIGAAIIWFIFKSKKLTIPEEQPWTIKKDWRTSIISCNTKNKRNGMLFFASFWNSLCLVMCYFLFFTGRSVEKAEYFTLIFPLIGVLLLYYAIRKSIDFARYGTLTLTMDPFPASIGGHFGGYLTFNRQLPKNSTVSIKLNCIKRTKRGSGDDRSTHEELLWYNTGFAYLEPSGTQFRLDIPKDLSESSLTNLGIQWRAEITVSYSNHHFDRQFTVPVFHTSAKSSIDLRSETHPAAKEHASELINDVTEFSKDGEHYSVSFPNFRQYQLSLLLGMLVGSGLLTLSVLTIIYDGMPLIMSIVFGFIGILFAGLSFFEAFYTLKVSLEPNKLVSTSKWLGIPFKTSTIKADQIASFEVADYFRRNDNGGKHTSYHSLKLIDQHQKKTTIGIRLKNKATAEEMKKFYSAYYQLDN